MLLNASSYRVFWTTQRIDGMSNGIFLMIKLFFNALNVLEFEKIAYD